MPPTYFRGVTNYGEVTLSENLKASVMMWCDWCFFNIGAFTNVRLNSSGYYGGDFSRLRPSDKPGYTAGYVWETPRSNLVWESGGAYSPIDPSGAYVNGTLVPCTVNYPLGQVIFNSGINQNSNVKMEYSFKKVMILDADDIPVFSKSQPDSYRVDNPNYLAASSGIWSRLPESRIQFPFIAVDTVGRSNTGYELGNDVLLSDQTVAFHVFSEKPQDVKKISEILLKQQNSKMYMIDFTTFINQSGVILDNGNKTNTTKTYPELITSHRGNEVYVKKTTGEDIQEITPDLYRTTIKFTIETLT